MRSSSFPEIPVSPSIRHRTDFENIWSTTTDEWMSWVWTSGWPLSCPDRLQGEEHLVPHLLTYADDGFLQELIGSSLLIEDLPCARHNGSSRLEIFLLHLQPLSSFFATKNKQTKKTKTFQGTSFCLFLWIGWGLEGGKCYHWKYSGMSCLHLGFCIANSHFLNELFLCTFAAVSPAVSCIYYTLNEYLSIDLVQVCDSINILWKMRNLSTQSVRIPTPHQKKKQKKKTPQWWSLA